MQIEILRDRRIFVYFHLNKGGQYRIRSPPDLKFELKIKFQIQEDKTVKYAPKKVFILENGKYKEITCLGIIVRYGNRVRAWRILFND